MLPGLEKLMIMRVVLNEKLKRTKSKITSSFGSGVIFGRALFFTIDVY
jgi:hypothetical protein